jgi:hypothetical protein
VGIHFQPARRAPTERCVCVCVCVLCVLTACAWVPTESTHAITDNEIPPPRGVCVRVFTSEHHRCVRASEDPREVQDFDPVQRESCCVSRVAPARRTVARATVASAARAVRASASKRWQCILSRMNRMEKKSIQSKRHRLHTLRCSLPATKMIGTNHTRVSLKIRKRGPSWRPYMHTQQRP